MHINTTGRHTVQRSRRRLNCFYIILFFYTRYISAYPSELFYKACISAFYMVYRRYLCNALCCESGKHHRGWSWRDLRGNWRSHHIWAPRLLPRCFRQRGDSGGEIPGGETGRTVWYEWCYRLVYRKTDGSGLCSYLCSSFIWQCMPPTDARSAGVTHCPLKRCTQW